MSTYGGSRVIASGTMPILACWSEVLGLLSLIATQTNLKYVQIGFMIDALFYSCM